MKNYWELEPSKVQVKIKDEKHLDELFKMCGLFGLKINKDYYNEYRNSDNWFRMISGEPWFGNYNFDYNFTEVTTEQFYEILCHNYGYKDEIEGFDKDVVLGMLGCQVKQGRNRNIKVFENSCSGGFLWSNTEEGYDFWFNTIQQQQRQVSRATANQCKK